MSGITTHVLDTSIGRPAGGVDVRLEFLEGSQWEVIGSGTTDSDGRLRTLMSGRDAIRGVYRITFDTGDYFSRRGHTTFFPEVAIVFQVLDPEQHHHVPLLVSPFGYSTYRGS